MKNKNSLSSQIKRLRERIVGYKDQIQILYEKLNEKREIINEIYSIMPMKYFKIDFEMEVRDSTLKVKETEVHESLTLNLAINKVKKGKAKPQTFKLLDVKILN